MMRIFALLALLTTTLPFTPPATWKNQITVHPNYVAVWTNGQSRFAVSTIAPHVASIVQRLRAAGRLGTVLDFNPRAKFCGAPAAVAEIRLKDSAEILSESYQNLDDVTYVAAYTRPATEKRDPAINGVMTGFCGKKSLTTLQPPPGWIASDAEVAGLWLSPDSSRALMLVSRKPGVDAAVAAREAIVDQLHATAVVVASDTTGTLCDKPARFFAGTATVDGRPTTLRAEVTQSASTAYVLVYGSETKIPIDDESTTSLATLCANP